MAKRLPCFGESEVLPQYGDLVFRSQRMVSELTISFCVHIHVSQCWVTSLPFCIWLYRLVLNLGYSFCFWYPLLILFWNKLWNIKLNVCHCSLIYGRYSMVVLDASLRHLCEAWTRQPALNLRRTSAKLDPVGQSFMRKKFDFLHVSVLKHCGLSIKHSFIH